MSQGKIVWRRLSKFWWVILMAIGAVAWSSAHLRSHAESHAAADDPPTVDVQQVVPRMLVRRLKVEAELQPFQEVDVHAKVAGYVKEIYVDIGSRVHAGQLMAVLSVPELEHERDGASADVAQRQHELVRAESEFQALHVAYSRLREVSGSEQNLVAQQELDDAASKDRSAQAAVSAAEAALASARANDARIRSLLSYTRITAPFTGIVVRRFAHVGTMLPAGTSSSTQALPLVHLSQNDPLRLVIPVPESAAPFIHNGTPVRVHIAAIERTFDASVTRFSSALDLTTRTLRAEADVPNPHFDLTPGEYADADITLERRKNALSVPVESVAQQDGRASVLAITPQNIVERRTVTLGLETPHAVEITSGLRAGERVIVSNQLTVKPGDRVEPRLIPGPAAEDR